LTSQRLWAACDPAHELTGRTPLSAFAAYPCTVHCRPQRYLDRRRNDCPRGADRKRIGQAARFRDYTRMWTSLCTHAPGKRNATPPRIVAYQRHTVRVLSVKW